MGFDNRAAQQSVLRNRNTGDFPLFASFCPSLLNTKKDVALHFFVNDILSYITIQLMDMNGTALKWYSFLIGVVLSYKMMIPIFTGALDGWGFAAFLNSFLASSFFSFQAFSQPTHPPSNAHR